jgi:SAM-dependent methyltransferase
MFPRTKKQQQRNSKKLILGSAGKGDSEAITLDINPLHEPDVIHDLNQTPYPFGDNQFASIVAHHIVEHLKNLGPVLEELHRISAPEGCIHIEVPHHASWCANDPFHILRFNYFSFDGFIQGNKTWATGKKFVYLKKEITFHKFHRLFFLHKLFNKFPGFYERFFCYIFPAEHLKVWLQPKK